MQLKNYIHIINSAKPLLSLQYFFLLAVTLLSSCKLNTDRIIENYELETNSIKIAEIVEKNEFIPFYAKDSLEIINTHHDSFLNTKLESLNKQLFEITEKYKVANEELKTIENPLMIKAYGGRVDIIKEDRICVEDIIYIYKNNPEQTQLNQYIIKKNHYSKIANSIIGYKLSVLFNGKQGELIEEVFNKEYLFNINKESIIAIIE